MICFEIRGAGFSDRHLHVTITLDQTTVDIGLMDKNETRELGITLLRAADELLEHSGVLDYTDKRLGGLIKQAEQFSPGDRNEI